nr:immunoglobulin light chain junction region [Macaca mulatta]MOW13134.1 immunoglobulin light chain junction region [Macaca mulatta]MOX97413.1 immunoglobulin light chain junction region [Macaca mulatta]MOX98876.1 immunoglobulin light chain junction region [Macaca mulatta]MOX99170.1 immunoglobulin light chain junction region [Macaca mulatta]
CQQYHSAPYSF